MGGPGEDHSPAPLTRARRTLLGAFGFCAAGAVSGAVALSTGGGAASAVPSPTASAVPTQPDVQVLSVSRVPEQDGFVSMVVLNRGPAVRIGAPQVVGTGYGTSEGGGTPGLGVRGTGSLFVAVRPDCSAGIGVPRRPELRLEVSTADGEETTLRVPLTGSAALPPELVGQCDAPLGDGARVSVRPVPSGGSADVRLELTLTAGRGLLWVEEVVGDVSVLDLGGGTALVQPGATEVVEMVLRVSSCDGPPPAPQLKLRREPGLEPRVVSFDEAGGQAYRSAVAAAVRRVCG